MSATHLDMEKATPLQWLRTADPELAREVAVQMAGDMPLLLTPGGQNLVEEIIWGLSRESAFGRAIALGGMRLLKKAPGDELAAYLEQVHLAGRVGATRGRLVAEHLAPVLLSHRQGLIKAFPQVLTTMLSKGTYTLKAPLEALTQLLEAGHLDSASTYLELLAATFRQELTYNRCLHLTYLLPKAVLAFGTGGRFDRIRQLTRVITVAHPLADAFIAGMERGLDLLRADRLERFVTLALDRFDHNQSLGRKFLSLESKLGIDTCDRMQVTVTLTQVQTALNRYLKARTGLPVAVRPLTALPKTMPSGRHDTKPWVLSDSRTLYLPEEISRYDERIQNRALYKVLAKLEAGCLEFGTHTFDFERALTLLEARRMVPDHVQPPEGVSPTNHHDQAHDHGRFYRLFAAPRLAETLFTIFEFGRVRVCLYGRYPGLARQADSVMAKEYWGMAEKQGEPGLLFSLYGRIALGISRQRAMPLPRQHRPMVAACEAHFKKADHRALFAEPTIVALLVAIAYPAVAAYLAEDDGERFQPDGYLPLRPPFGRWLRPELNLHAQTGLEELARQIQGALARQDIRVYRDDVTRHLEEKKGRLDQQDLASLVLGGRHSSTALRVNLDLAWRQIEEVMTSAVGLSEPESPSSGKVFRYREWDRELNDYLGDHVRVMEREVPSRNGDFYLTTIERHQDLVKQLRYAFELLKPQALTILRQWLEGDEFDYRALLDFALDRRAGLMPSERLYIKRIKQVRDVAVLLLVDLSRSTANAVAGTAASVLDVEKEAIVLFSEALTVVGDAFAIAGFSGNGRFQVDYYPIKAFEEDLDEGIHGRIDAMAPKRSTRMGAAVRHATSTLHGFAAKVKIMILLGDGFPNDVDYKNAYAIADTRRAIWEARSQSIHVKAITVNMGVDHRLDDLYGDVHHSIITDVRELPDKLLRVYSSLTRY